MDKYDRVSEAFVSAIIDLVEVEKFDTAAGLCEVIDPFVVRDAVMMIVDHQIPAKVPFLLCQLLKEIESEDLRANIIQVFADRFKTIEAMHVFILGQYLESELLTSCFSEQTSMIIQEELWCHSEKYSFYSALQSISPRMELREVLVEDNILKKEQNHILCTGPFHVASSVGSYTGDFSAEISNIGLTVTSATIDTSSFDE